MDWIERTLGISPDGGNGLTELLIVFALLAIVILAVRLKRSRFWMDRDSR
jgi:hypothetical protein